CTRLGGGYSGSWLNWFFDVW
nr:immunoglobulin heavy chain junction region [Macaca mulatta]